MRLSTCLPLRFCFVLPLSMWLRWLSFSHCLSFPLSLSLFLSLSLSLCLSLSLSSMSIYLSILEGRGRGRGSGVKEAFCVLECSVCAHVLSVHVCVCVCACVCVCVCVCACVCVCSFLCMCETRKKKFTCCAFNTETCSCSFAICIFSIRPCSAFAIDNSIFKSNISRSFCVNFARNNETAPSSCWGPGLLASSLFVFRNTAASCFACMSCCVRCLTCACTGPGID